MSNKTDSEDVSSENNSSKGDLIPFAIIYILGIFLFMYILIILHNYYNKNKTSRYIKQTVNNRGSIKKYQDICELCPETCTICYNNYEINENIFTFNECRHNYHLNCVKTLFSKNGSRVKCPYCNT